MVLGQPAFLVRVFYFMAKRIILDDCNGNEIEVSLFDGLCLIKAGQNFDEDYYNGTVLFDKDDIDELIKVLEEFKKEHFSNERV